MTYVFAGIFVMMILYIAKFMVFDSQSVIANSYNARQDKLAEHVIRGDIVTMDGEVIATNQYGADGSEYRYYPHGSMFAHAVGYSTNGKAGVELTANYYLLTSNANIFERTTNALQEKKNMGDTIVTTLDYNLQSTAYNALGYGKGAVLVLEPDTGRILAMVSKPDFDPNSIDSIWKSVTEGTVNDDTILLNRATQGLYPPGSTFKIVTALEYIRENPDSYSQYTYQCNGMFTHGEETINCYHGTVHGYEDFTKSFAKSCNASFANIGMQLDRGRFADTLEDLLFNQELKAGFAYNQSRLLIDENTEDADVMQAAIGQGTTAVTPLQMNMITCAIANDGMLMKPYLVDHVETHEGNVIKQFAATTYKRLMSEQEAAIMKGLMQEVVQSGTGTKLKDASYTAAGKTGSAEYNAVKTDSHAWFTGFAPVEDPQLCVTIIIEGAGSGGDYAVPIARRIFDAYFE